MENILQISDKDLQRKQAKRISSFYQKLREFLVFTKRELFRFGIDLFTDTAAILN